MGKSQRTKGKVRERKIAASGRDAGLDSERQTQQARVSDKGDVHIRLRPTTVLPATVILVEVKDHKRPTFGLATSAIEQCEGYKTSDQDIAVAAIHIPRTSEDYVFMRRRTFVQLIGGVVAPEPVAEPKD